MSNTQAYPLDARDLARLTSKDFANFLSKRDDYNLTLSMALPMETSGSETRKNHIVFKNALAKAETLMEERGEDFEVMKSALRDLAGMTAETDSFWQHQNKGLLIYLTQEGTLTALKLPFAPNQRVALSDTPHLTPLLKLVNLPEVLVLKIDLNKTGLYRTSSYQCETILLEDTPMSLEEAMKYDDPEESLQNRSISSGAGTAFHGQGGTGDETKKKKIQRFFEMLDQGLMDKIADLNQPLVLLGPEQEVGIFKKVCKYPHLCEDPISINPSSLSREELEATIQKAGEKQADCERSEALEDFRASLPHQKASIDPAEVIKSAMHGKVADLFVVDGAEVYGRFDKDTAETHINPSREPGDYDLVHRAAFNTAEKGGRVFFIAESSQLPDQTLLAAKFRY